MPFKFKSLDLPGAYLVKFKQFPDERGFFGELFREDLFARAGIVFRPVQVNMSHSRHGVLRGLHFQRGDSAQAKLVFCLQGEIYDVIVDIRPDSPTFGKWYGAHLSEYDNSALFVPKGFAHGFQVLSRSATVVYLVDNLYDPSAEGGVRWDDPDLSISWPVRDPIISQKDRSWPYLQDLFGR